MAALSAPACTPSRRIVRTPGTTSISTVTQTISKPPTTLKPAPRRSAPPTGPLSQPGKVVEKTGDCPYLSTQAAQDDNGSRIGQHTVVTTTPPGCRFYALNAAGYGQKGAAGRISIEISTARYRTAGDAQQGMIRTALRGSDIDPIQANGHKGSIFRTTFSPADGDQDWACTFSIGKLVITVKTDRTDVSANAVKLATDISPKFS